MNLHKNKSGSTDPFVLTRKINNPELIWNQNPIHDSYARDRFFQVDAAK